jgi:hypothetical protein
LVTGSNCHVVATQAATFVDLDRVGLELALVGRETKANRIHRITTPSRKWVAEPADITTVRFHTGSATSPASRRRVDIVVLRGHPDDLDEASEGSALTPYSVSPA